jgi:hypothetical protein
MKKAAIFSLLAFFNQSFSDAKSAVAQASALAVDKMSITETDNKSDSTAALLIGFIM